MNEISKSPSNKVLIIGGGVSGLVNAYSAIQSGSSVILHEKSNRLGGLIGTKLTENGYVEQAANGFLNSYFIEKLTQDLGIELLKPEKAANKRRFFRSNKLYKIPISIFQLLRAVIGFCFINSEPQENENMETWSQRVFGKAFTKFIVEPAIGGIYSTELKLMYVQLVFSKFTFHKNRSLLRNIFLNRKNKSKSEKPKIRGLVSFKKGMQELIDSLHSFIIKNNLAKIHLNSEITNLNDILKSHSGSEIRICTSLSGTLRLLQNWDIAKEILNEYKLDPFTYQSITTVTRFGMDTIFPYPAFGILFPREEGILAKGILANHSIFKGRVKNKPYSETWIYSGNWIQDKNDDDIKYFLEEDRKKLLSLSKLESLKTNSDIHIKIWKNAFPIYNKNLYNFNLCLDEIELACKGRNIPIRFYGNYRRGIGLRSLIENAMN